MKVPIKLLLFCVVAFRASPLRNFCRITTATHNDCQSFCDFAPRCGAWVWQSTNNRCYMTHQFGIHIEKDPGVYSGFKNGGSFVLSDTNLWGSDYKCEDEEMQVYQEIYKMIKSHSAQEMETESKKLTNP